MLLLHILFARADKNWQSFFQVGSACLSVGMIAKQSPNPLTQLEFGLRSCVCVPACVCVYTHTPLTQSSPCVWREEKMPLSRGITGTQAVSPEQNMHVESKFMITLVACSRRNSLWANSALVVAVQPPDWAHLEPQHGALAGVALQIQAERYTTHLTHMHDFVSFMLSTRCCCGAASASCTGLQRCKALQSYAACVWIHLDFLSGILQILE